MKNLTRILSLALVCVLAMSLIACSGSTNTPDPTEAPTVTDAPEATEAPEVTEAPEITDEPAPTDDFDWSAYPEDFSAWTIGDMKTYLTAKEILGNDEFMLIDMSAELEQMSADAGFIYIDATGFTVNDTIIHFDAANEAGAAMLETVRAQHAIVVGEASVPMDAMLGAFTFSYGNSLDEAHIAAITEAINALAAHYGITPDFIG